MIRNLLKNPRLRDFLIIKLIRISGNIVSIIMGVS